MMKKFFTVNIQIMLGILLVPIVLAIFLVRHHQDIPAEVQAHRRDLIGSGMTTADRIAPVAKLVMAQSATSSTAPAQANAVVQVKERDGQQVYQASCVACHGAGIAGAPKAGDKSQWSTRLSKGTEALYLSALTGLQSPAGVMPAKGGNPSLSDQEIKASVDFMIAQVQ